MGFESFIALKHLTRRRKTGFISLISLISIGGVAVGVMALIVVLAVMSGFDSELKSKIVNVQPHLRIEKIGGLDQPEADIQKLKGLHLPAVQTLSPFIEGQAILRSDSNATGVVVKGLDAEHEDFAVYRDHLKYGEISLDDVVTQTKKRWFFFFTKTETRRTGSILIGEVLASVLRVQVGDTLALITPFKEDGRKFSLVQSESRPFVVAGIFRMGMNDFDTSLALVGLERAQAMYHLGRRVTGISVRFQDVDLAEKWKYAVRREFGADYYARSWYDMNHNFFQALKVEKSVMAILLALIICVAAFNIVASLTMVVMEKTKDIGILRALGATPMNIRKIFVMEGFTIGFFGVLLGTACGLALAYHLNPVSDFIKKTTGLEVFPSDVYYFDKIPAQVHLEDVLVTVIFAMVAAVFAGFYPAHRAAALNPIEALRYE